MPDVIRYERRGALLDIVLSDPDGGNLVSNEEGDRLVATLAALDDDVKLVRLRSSGADFCLGRVSPMPKPGTPGVTAHFIKRVVAEPAIRVYTALGAAPVPVLGVVRGRAEGYGLGLLAAADVVLAGEAAAFSIPEMLRQIPPTLVMTALLGRAPAKLVAHLVLSQEAIGAADPRALGLVSKVVADEALDGEMDALTERILAYRSDSVRAIKEYLRFAEGRDRSAAGSFAANLAASALSARFGGGQVTAPIAVTLTVNGETITHAVAPHLLLVEFLRGALGLTGAHVGCDTSQCGACTVLVDDRSVKSCTMLAVQADGARVTTIEGLADGDALHPLQAAFRQCHALQCGFCTPGMIMAGVALLQRDPDPSEHQVREWLEGNICRCTGYHNIVRAMLAAAAEMRG